MFNENIFIGILDAAAAVFLIYFILFTEKIKPPKK